MIILSILCLLFSNAVTMRRDMSILFNRIAIIALVYCFLHDLVSLSLINKGIGLHGGLLHVTNITQIFHIFVFIVSILILQLTSFYPAAQCGILQSWVRLSNSGELLKIMIPSVIQKVKSGWGNYSSMVTSHNMSENKMDNRGCKSIVYKSIVKEQRIDGSLRVMNLKRIRFILKGFERNCQIRIPFNQINMYKCYSSATLQCASTLNNFKINPWFITGFTDAEGCFTVFIVRDNRYKTGWDVRLSFQITLDQRDLSILKHIQNYFGVGSIIKQGESTYMYRVRSIKDMASIIKHFEDYPLLSEKQADYELLNKAYNIILNKEHLTLEGLNKIASIKASLKRGLSSDLLLAFPNVIPKYKSSLVQNSVIPVNPDWLAGFTSGEGCFYIKIVKSNTKLGEAVSLTFQLTQHLREESLIRSIASYLDCGKIYKNRESIYLDITKFSDLTGKVLPILEKHPIMGKKILDFEDFCKVAELMKNKAHLTQLGLEAIRKIKAGMNTGIR